MNFNDWIRVSVLALGTYAVALLGFMIGGSIAPALGVGSLTAVLGAVGAIVAVIAVALVVERFHSALSSS